MAFTEQEEAKVRELLVAFENGKRINELDGATGPIGSMQIEVMDESGETRHIELERAVSESGNPIAGRWWDESNATPTAAGWFGSLSALKELPATLGLGRYLVADDRTMRKLDPTDSTRFLDGSPAALDGSMGQCMWCWSRAWYFTEWKEGNRTFWAITLKPIEGRKSYHIPVGGVSWLGAGVMDRTEQKLCSVISEDERYRGGNGTALTLAAKAYMQGQKLVPDCDYYDTTGMTEQAIADAKVVKYAVATESNTVVYIKVAREVDGNPASLTDGQLDGLTAYMNEIKDAGVSVQLRNEPADKMRIDLLIYYDPTLLTIDSTGAGVLVSGEDPVREATKQVIENLPFNGMFRKSDLLAALQALPCVEVADIKSVQVKPSSAELWQTVESYDRPYSGYYSIDRLTVDYKPYKAVE